MNVRTWSHVFIVDPYFHHNYLIYTQVLYMYDLRKDWLFGLHYILSHRIWYSRYYLATETLIDYTHRLKDWNYIRQTLITTMNKILRKQSTNRTPSTKIPFEFQIKYSCHSHKSHRSSHHRSKWMICTLWNVLMLHLTFVSSLRQSSKSPFRIVSLWNKCDTLESYSLDLFVCYRVNRTVKIVIVIFSTKKCSTHWISTSLSSLHSYE